MLFKVGDTDYTRKIISGSYGVNDNDIYKEWTDANFETHRHVYRSQATGSFTMYFGRQSDFQEFLSKLGTVKNNNGSYTIGLSINNKNEFRNNMKCFVDFEPTREQRVLGEAWYPQVQIKIEEV